MTVRGQKYEYGVDFDRITAIDIHTHVEIDGHGHKAYVDELVEATAKYFNGSVDPWHQRRAPH